MQNTSRIQSVPNTLIKNFFISGVSQGTLAAKIAERYRVNIQPEVLFSMYSPKEVVASYLQFVFPENIDIQYSHKEPKFYTFMSTDSSGYNFFFHCMIFYEEINEADLKYDFDVKKARQDAINTRKQNEKLQKAKQKRKPKRGIDVQTQLAAAEREKYQIQRKYSNINILCAPDIAKHKHNEDYVEMQFTNSAGGSPGTSIPSKSKVPIEKIQQQELKAQRNQYQMQEFWNGIAGTGLGTSRAVQDSSKSAYQSFHRGGATTPRGANAMFSQQDKGQTSPTQKSWLGPTTKQIQEKALQQQMQQRKMLQSPKKSSPMQMNLDPKFQLSPTATPAGREMEFSPGLNNGAGSINFDNMAAYQSQNKLAGGAMNSGRTGPDLNIPFKKQSSKVIEIEQASPDKFREFIKSQQPTEFKLNNMMIQTPGVSGINRNVLYSEDMNESSNGITPNNLGASNYEKQLDILQKSKLHIPVAFVIETETEYHDVFRQMLISLFELQSSRNGNSNSSNVNVTSMTPIGSDSGYEAKLFRYSELIAHLAYLKTIPAPPFNSLYNIQFLGQTISIKETAFTEIPNKNQNAIRILFDCLDLVLVSSQFSLQFYVAEALKQLLFPLTWQNSYIQPGSEKLKGLCDGTITMIYTTPGIENDFDYFDGISPYVAVCDIDACYTNNIALPTIDSEQLQIRFLNTMKNCRLQLYDMAYPDQCPQGDIDFVNDVRKAFFKILQPYLINIDTFIDQSADKMTASFDKYFKKKEYLNQFSDNKVMEKFAKELMESSQFVHFCDDYYSEELNNFQMFQAILRARGDISTQVKKMNLFNPKFEKQNQPEYQDLPVIFHFRMPVSYHRAMIFEKIEYMIAESLKKREEDISRASDKETLMGLVNNDNQYDQTLKLIKKLYQQKIQERENLKMTLKSTPQKYQGRKSNDAKLIQESGKREESKLEIPPMKYQHSRNSSQGSVRINIQEPNESSTSQEFYRQNYPYQQNGNQQLKKQNTIDSLSFASDKFSEAPTNNNRQYNNGQGNSGMPYLHSKTSQRQFYQVPGNDIIKLPFGNAAGTVTNKKQHQSQFQDFQQSRDEASSFIQGSQYLNDSSEDEYQGSSQLIQPRLVYGKQGLLNILAQLYTNLNEIQRKGVNYYFSLQCQLSPSHAKKAVYQPGQQQSIILEDPYKEDELSPKNSPYKKPTQKLSTSSLGTQSRFGFQIIGVPRAQTGLTHLQQSAIFTNSDQWFKAERADGGNCKKMRRTYQYILTKAKIYESFECLESGYSLIFFELIKFPSKAIEFFPLIKCEHIWANLTTNQKNQIYQKYGYHTSKIDGYQKPNECLKLVMQRHNEYNSPNKTRYDTMPSTNGGASPTKHMQADEKLFCQDSLDSPYSKKRNHSSSSLSNHNNFSPPYTNKKSKINLSLFQYNIGETSHSSMKLNTNVQSKTQLKNAKDLIKSKLNLTMKIRSLPVQNCQDTIKSERSNKSEILKFEKHKSNTDIYKTISSHIDTSTLNYDLSGKYPKRDSKIEIFEDAEHRSAKPLRQIIEFWQKNYIYVDKNGKFQEQHLESIKVQLEVFVKYFKFLKKKNPDFKNDDISQQVFFLNIHNFLVLHKIAMLMYSEPEALQKLTSYSMWQHFLNNTTITIAGIKISAFYIQHAILRQTLQKPEISKFILNIEYVDTTFFGVKEPSKLISFGLFLPLNGQPELKIFKRETYEHQLRQAAAELISRKIKFKDGNSLVILPKFVYWYNNDFNGKNSKDIFDFLINRVFVKDSELRTSLKKAQTAEYQDLLKANIQQLYIDYKCYGWTFNPQRLAHYFADKKNIPMGVSKM